MVQRQEEFRQSFVNAWIVSMSCKGSGIVWVWVSHWQMLGVIGLIYMSTNELKSVGIMMIIHNIHFELPKFSAL